MTIRTRFALVGASLLVLFAVLSAPRPVEAQGSTAEAGSVLAITAGRLEVLRQGTWRPLARGSAVSARERVRTDEHGIAVLDLPGRGRTVIGPASELILPAAGTSPRIELTRGALWIDASLRRGTTLRIGTPQAVAAVRGTNFSVLADDSGSAICTCRGTVDVELQDSRTVRAGTGQFVPVAADGAAPRRARDDRDLLLRARGDRYDWCFTCHEVGNRGRLRRGWNAEALGV